MQPLIDSVHPPQGGKRRDGGEGAVASGAGATRPAVPQRLVLLAGRRWFWPVATVLGYLGQLAFRLVLVRHNYFPSVHADETSYLVIARVLAGRPTTEMPVGVVIPGGYPLLLAPALWIADTPAFAYHLVMGTNAVLNALVFPLAFLFARRLGLRRGMAYLAATAAALLPPVVFYSEFAMSDTVLPVLLLGWLIAMHGWLSPGSPRRRALHAVAMGLTAGYTMAVHDRGGVVVALTAVVLLAALVVRWAPWRTTLAGLGALAVGLAAAKALAIYVKRYFRSTPESSVGNQVMENLTQLDRLGTTLARTVGQLWYFMMSTWGLGAIALVLCVAALLSRRFTVAQRVVAGCLVALACGVALAAAAGLPATDRRVDNWVYARYLAPLTPAFFLVGTAALVRSTVRTLVRLALAGAAVMTAAGLTVFAYAGRELSRPVTPWTVPDAQFLASTWEGLHLWRSTAGALVVLGAVLLLRYAGGRRVVWALVACLGLFACYATVTVTQNVAEPYAQERKYLAVDFTEESGIRQDDSVVFAWDLDWGMRMAQAYEVYDGRVWWRDPRWQGVPRQATVVVTPEPKDGESPEAYWSNRPAGWYVAEVSDEHDWVLWRKR